MPHTDGLQDAYRRIETTNEALFKTREDGLVISKALDLAWQDIRALNDMEARHAALRKAWMSVQKHLTVVQAESADAMDYFVEIKNRMKRMIEKGEVGPVLLPLNPLPA